LKPADSIIPVDWEALWAPYDEATYGAALAFLEPGDIVLDIGAGDLRFARRAASCVQKVFAIERDPEVLGQVSGVMPKNLEVVCADARTWPFPHGITVGVLLMRHCRHFQDYVTRLRGAGCQRLITNARWGMDVESIALAVQAPYSNAPPGWYACACGAVGFKDAAVEEIRTEALDTSRSVEDCPACLASRVGSPGSRR
jgi:hypothetical protein